MVSGQPSCARNILSPRSVVIFRVDLFFRTSLIFEQDLFSSEMFNFCNMYFILSSLYDCMVNIKLKYNFVLTPRKFIIAEVSICKLGSSFVQKLLCMYVYKFDFSKQVLFFCTKYFCPVRRAILDVVSNDALRTGVQPPL